jgi:hypothetical protein
MPPSCRVYLQQSNRRRIASKQAIYRESLASSCGFSDDEPGKQFSTQELLRRIFK